jgi:DNA-binding GntR family transcriptional regulator
VALHMTSQMADTLARDRPGLASSSTADRVAELLRTHIMQGLFPPGTRLPEEAIGQALEVSRNTLREAFRLLCHERLAVHHMNRGIFVPVLSSRDVVDLYGLRRLVEGGAARRAGSAPMEARRAILAIVGHAEKAAAAGCWLDVRTDDLRFHQAVAALVGSPRVDELMRRALAEMGLIFHVITEPAQFHAPYIGRNRVIAELIVDGDGDVAEAELLRYLDDAERQILDAYERSAAVATG